MNAARFGLVSAVTASLCCVGPLLLLTLGLGSLGLGAVLGRLHWWFLTAAALFLLAGWHRYLREQRRCRAQACQMVRGGLTRGTLVAASVLVATFTSLNAWSTFAQPAAPAAASAAEEGTTVVIPITGMTCAMCEAAIERNLAQRPGVIDVDAQVASEQVVVTYDPEQIGVGDLVEAINQTGYRATAPPPEGAP